MVKKKIGNERIVWCFVLFFIVIVRVGKGFLILIFLSLREKDIFLWKLEISIEFNF